MGGPAVIRWATLFVDAPATTFGAETDFWSRVTGYDVSPARGEHDEFVSLVPADGDPALRVQRLDHGPPGVHLDLHVEDPRAVADRASDLGAVEVADHGYVVLRSPGGFPFCLVPPGPSRPPTAPSWPGGNRSQVDQLCLDVPDPAHDAEAAFWTELTGWELRPLVGEDEFTRLDPPSGFPVLFLLQRLDEQTGAVRAHLDLAADDRPTEVARHLELGAVHLGDFSHWTVLRDPAGLPYCITDRDPS